MATSVGGKGAAADLLGGRDLRRRYFAAGAAAQRFDVTYDDVLEHLANARIARPRLRLRAVVFVDDLLHAIALHRGQARAWDDVDARYVMPLIQRCFPLLDDAGATLHVRQVLHRLRTDDGTTRDQHTFRSYVGTQPLGLWLTERVLGTVPRNDVGRQGPLDETLPYQRDERGPLVYPGVR